MKKLILVAVIVAVLVGGGSFYGGMKYAQSKTPVRGSGFGGTGNFAGLRGNGGARGGATGAGFTSGDIISKDATSITIKLQDGGSKIVFYSNATKVSKFVDGTAGDLIVGKTVSITGTANSDGSITASLVQLRPAISPSPSPK